jgi:group I intron endonuclease
VITYIATNTLNGKFYIGSTNNLPQRIYDHINCHRNYPFQNALRKNPDKFVWESYEDSSDEPILEQNLLDMWYGKGQCYNLNPVAGRPPVCTGHTQETMEKMKATRNTEEYKSRAREKTLEQFKDEEHRARHREATIRGSNTPEAKRKTSEKSLLTWSDPDYRERMREAHSGKGLPWWVKEDGTTTRSQVSPGTEWQRGRKWKPQ